jgi:hypothetical protein
MRSLFRRTPPNFRLKRRPRPWLLPLLALLLGWLSPACRPAGPPAPTRERASAVLERHRGELLATHGAVGAGVSRAGFDDERFVIVVYLAADAAVDARPRELDGVMVMFQKTGEIRLPAPRAVAETVRDDESGA